MIIHKMNEPRAILIDEALAMVKDGRIKDAKTAYAILRYALERKD